MKKIIVLCVSLFFCSCGIWQQCQENNTEQLKIISVVLVDSIISNVDFYKTRETEKNVYSTGIINLPEPVHVKVYANDDSLEYNIKIENGMDAFIYLDTIPFTCDTAYNRFSRSRLNHVYSNSSKTYSCTFDYEPSCE